MRSASDLQCCHLWWVLHFTDLLVTSHCIDTFTERCQLFDRMRVWRENLAWFSLAADKAVESPQVGRIRVLSLFSVLIDLILLILRSFKVTWIVNFVLIFPRKALSVSYQSCTYILGLLVGIFLTLRQAMWAKVVILKEDLVDSPDVTPDPLQVLRNRVLFLHCGLPFLHTFLDTAINAGIFRINVPVFVRVVVSQVLVTLCYPHATMEVLLCLVQTTAWYKPLTSLCSWSFLLIRGKSFHVETVGCGFFASIDF